jgi:hypothetical protein
MTDILNNAYIVWELLKIDDQDIQTLSSLRNYYNSLSDLTNKFKKHPVECGYSESEWAETYNYIRSSLMSIPNYENKYPYHTGLLRDILDKAPLTFPE